MDEAVVLSPDRRHILFFDGECAMCNGIVRWLYPRDRDHVLTFASLHGETASQMRAELADFPTSLDTFVFYDDGEIRVRSRAAFFVARSLTAPWRFAYILRLVPRWLSDVVYDLVARNRVRWFGKAETCWLPPADAMGRFLC